MKTTQNIATHKSASLCGGSRSDLGFAGCQANDDEEEYDDFILYFNASEIQRYIVRCMI